MKAITEYGRDLSGVLALFHDHLGVSPMNECKGPHGSTVLWYVIGERVVLVQVHPSGGWCEYVGSKTNNIEASIASLQDLRDGFVL